MKISIKSQKIEPLVPSSLKKQEVVAGPRAHCPSAQQIFSPGRRQHILPGMTAVLLAGIASPIFAAHPPLTNLVQPLSHLSAAEIRLEHLVKTLWPNAEAIACEPDRSGVSAFLSTKVTVDGAHFHVKMARATEEISVDEFAEEVKWATWAGTQQLAPPVVHADPLRGILVTQYAADAVPDWNEGAKEPKFSAMVHYMATMNKRETAPRAQWVPANQYLESALELVESAALATHNQPSLQDRLAVLRGQLTQIVPMLAGQKFLPARVHGDFHQNNFLYQPNGSVMVDWGRTKLGDPMQELSYLCYFSDRGIAKLPALLKIYGPSPHASLDKARVYLVLLHAKLFCEEALGLEPARKMASSDKLDYLWRFLQEDFRSFDTSQAE